MDIAELATRMKNHDWYHSFSDDHGVYMRGVRDAQEIQEHLVTIPCPVAYHLMKEYCPSAEILHDWIRHLETVAKKRKSDGRNPQS